MCSRFSRTYQIQAAAKRFKLGLPHPDRKNWKIKKFNIAPTDEAEVVVQTEEQREVRSMIFGLVPHWAKDPKIGLSCLNARAETVSEKPAFKEALKKRRCLILADGFYEWKHAGKIKQPYRVSLKTEEPFAFAGIWETWKRPDGRQFESFAIITTEPNELLKPIHDRMPVILKPENEETWLNPSLMDTKVLLPLLQAYPKGELAVYPVSTYVNNSANKGEESIKPLTKSEGELF